MVCYNIFAHRYLNYISVTAQLSIPPMVDMRINQVEQPGACELVDSFEVFRIQVNVDVWGQSVVWIYNLFRHCPSVPTFWA
ncbi:unnamed protein product [Brugia timori]|uniref:Uncharacterized protein n=1 Tax=Brugia timori TaxID=42155 RepID=A0A0R3RA62_9BILA|nr:unnamed protein product [Brugia timori]